MPNLYKHSGSRAPSVGGSRTANVHRTSRRLRQLTRMLECSCDRAASYALTNADLSWYQAFSWRVVGAVVACVSAQQPIRINIRSSARKHRARITQSTSKHSSLAPINSFGQMRAEVADRRSLPSITSKISTSAPSLFRSTQFLVRPLQYRCSEKGAELHPT